MEWTQKMIDVLTGPLPVAGVLGHICVKLWLKLEDRDKQLAAKDAHIQLLNDARIADLKAMLQQDD